MPLTSQPGCRGNFALPMVDFEKAERGTLFLYTTIPSPGGRERGRSDLQMWLDDLGLGLDGTKVKTDSDTDLLAD
jgi:hypothetical protein